MSFSSEQAEYLSECGQLAAEVNCPFDGYREFVSVYKAKSDSILAFEQRFPYFQKCENIYRVIRFRVSSQLIDQDHNFSNADLIGLQEIFLPSERAVEFILELWKLPVDQLIAPRNTEVPV